jgi:mono/diheme cytochrome c family protein
MPRAGGAGAHRRIAMRSRATPASTLLVNAAADPAPCRKARPSRGGSSTARAAVAAIALCAIAAAACSKQPPELTPAQSGEVVYRTNCISCHSRDPSMPGPLAPPIAGASRALIEARVIHGTYPPGYTPQRRTHTMRPLPWLDGHIDDLTAYLDAVPAHHPG